MTFQFWGGTDAETEFRADFMSSHRQYNYKGCHSKGEVEDAWKDLRAWSRRSKTARDLFAYIDRADEVIHVVGMSGGYQCFSSTAGQDKAKGTIYVDLDANIEFLCESPHNLHVDSISMSVMESSSGCPDPSWVRADNRIALLHEIGHGRQWIENPRQFDKDYRTATVAKQEKGKDVTMKQISRREILEKATAMAQKGKHNLDFLPEKDPETGGQKLEAAVAWDVPIEHDNMRRHEWPICLELGLPLRSSYSGIRGTPGGNAKAQLDSFIKRRVEEERQAMEQQKKAKLAADGLAPTGPLKCDLCPPTDPTTYKSRIFLNRHKDSVHR